MTNAPLADLRFEAAADAVVAGDVDLLRALLSEHPELSRARSSRSHRATLLHYLGANGVEDSRQKTPLNAVSVAEILLNAGAEVDDVADLYGGSTTLELVATSIHPQDAGVQLPLIETLLARGANPEREGSLVHACLANNRLAAAEFLADRGVALDLSAAAGLGRVSLVREYLNAEPSNLRATREDGQFSNSTRGFLWACGYGQDEVLLLFLDHGVPVNVPDDFGQTGAHRAAIGRHLTTLKLLISRGAALEIRNTYGGTVLGQALWSAAHDRSPDAWTGVIELLLQSGAEIPQLVPTVCRPIDELLGRWGRSPDPALSW